MKNDYKLNKIQKFWDDHVSRHIIAHDDCAKAVADLKTIVEKDKAYNDCHNSWVSDFKLN